MLDSLRKSSEFKTAFDQGSKHVGRRFVVFAANKNEHAARLGLVVSRKVGKAVTRNRVKRRIREYFRNHVESVPHRDIVVIARHCAAGAQTSEIWEELGRLMTKVQRSNGPV